MRSWISGTALLIGIFAGCLVGKHNRFDPGQRVPVNREGTENVGDRHSEDWTRPSAARGGPPPVSLSRIFGTGLSSRVDLLAFRRTMEERFASSPESTLIECFTAFVASGNTGSENEFKVLEELVKSGALDRWPPGIGPKAGDRTNRGRYLRLVSAFLLRENSPARGDNRSEWITESLTQFELTPKERDLIFDAWQVENYKSLAHNRPLEFLGSAAAEKDSGRRAKMAGAILANLGEFNSASMAEALELCLSSGTSFPEVAGAVSRHLSFGSLAALETAAKNTGMTLDAPVLANSLLASGDLGSLVEAVQSQPELYENPDKIWSAVALTNPADVLVEARRQLALSTESAQQFIEGSLLPALKYSAAFAEALSGDLELIRILPKDGLAVLIGSLSAEDQARAAAAALAASAVTPDEKLELQLRHRLPVAEHQWKEILSGQTTSPALANAAIANLTASDPDLLSSMLDTLPNDRRATAESALLSAWARNPLQNQTRVEALCAMADQDANGGEGLRNYAGELLLASPQAAVQLLFNLGDNALAGDAAEGTFATWARYDSHGASVAINQLPEGSLRDHAIIALTGEIQGDFEAAFLYAQEIGDADMRAQTVTNVLSTLGESDPAAALTILQNSELSEEDKSAIRAMLPTPR